MGENPEFYSSIRHWSNQYDLWNPFQECVCTMSGEHPFGGHAARSSVALSPLSESATPSGVPQATSFAASSAVREFQNRSPQKSQSTAEIQSTEDLPLMYAFARRVKPSASPHSSHRSARRVPPRHVGDLEDRLGVGDLEHGNAHLPGGREGRGVRGWSRREPKDAKEDRGWRRRM